AVVDDHGEPGVARLLGAPPAQLVEDGDAAPGIFAHGKASLTSRLSARSTIARSVPHGTIMTFPSRSMSCSSRQHFSIVGRARAPARRRGHISTRRGASP